MLPDVLFAVFSLLAAAGAFLIGDQFRSRRFAVVVAVAVLAFMVLMYLYVSWLIRSSGMTR